MPDDERRVEVTPTSETGTPLPRGEVCVPAMEPIRWDEPVNKVVGFARFIAESIGLSSRQTSQPRTKSVDEIMTGPNEMSADGRKRADALRGQPRSELAAKPLTVHRD